MLAAGGEELYGIFFRANVYVVEAIDEPLDEADCQIALCCTLVKPDSSAQRFWPEVTGSRRGSSRNSLDASRASTIKAMSRFGAKREFRCIGTKPAVAPITFRRLP